MPTLRPRVSGGDVKAVDGRISSSVSSNRDGRISALTKWIPIEIIALYQAFATPIGKNLAHMLPYMLVGGTIVTALWIAFATESAKKSSPIAVRQVVLSCMAFVFWVAGTTSPEVWQVIYPTWMPGFSPAILAAGAVALPIADGVMRRMGVPQD